MLLLLIACFSPPKTGSPTTSIVSAEQRLRLAIGRARQSDELACQAVKEAVAVAKLLQTRPDNVRNKEDLHGLRLDSDGVRPDWNILAEAIGPGSLSTSVITIGGIESALALPCVAPKHVESWTRRLQAIDSLPVCQDTLRTAAADVLTRVVESCTCEPVPDVIAAKLAVRLKKVDPDLAARYRTWTDTPTCPNTRLKE